MRAAVLVSLIATGVLASACGQGGGTAESATTAATAPAPAPKQLSAAEKTALLATLPAPYNSGDLANGQAKFGLCRSCHTITPGGANGVGPNLYGVFGRKAGTHEGYKYSDVVKNAGFNWDAEHLDKWLAQPRQFLPGTKMSFAGVKNEKDRIDLIAFLKVETGYQP